MKARRDRLARARALCNNLWRLEAMRLAQLESKLTELTEAQCFALRVLEQGSFDPMLLLRRLQMLTLQKVETEARHIEQLERTRAQGRRAKLTERLFERIDDAWRQEQIAAELRVVTERAATDKSQLRP